MSFPRHLRKKRPKPRPNSRPGRLDLTSVKLRSSALGRCQRMVLLRTDGRNIPTGWIMPPWEDPPMRLHQRLVSIFGDILKAVAAHLDEQSINAACREEKYTWRE